jgi:hypothetical protein
MIRTTFNSQARARAARTALWAALGSAACASTVFSARAAHAQTAADLDNARELFRQARGLREEGKLAEALEKFRAANAYAATPIIAYELAKTYAQAGQPIEAREAYLSIARIKVDPAESDRSKECRKEAPDLAEQLRTKAASLTIRVQAPAGTTPVVKVDGLAMPAEALGQPRRVNPGTHEVTAKLEGGQEQKKTATLAEGALGELSFDLAPAVVAVAVPVQIEKPKAGFRMHPMSWVGFGVGATGLIFGTVGGAVALGKRSTVTTLCGPDTVCPASSEANVKSALSTGRTWAAISTLSFIVAGLGIGVGVAGFFLPKGDEEKPTEAKPADAKPTDAKPTDAPKATSFKGTFTVSPWGVGYGGTF